MGHEGYHEPYGELPESVRDVHRAIISIMEELEAIDWYYQRAAVTRDASLKAILLHNAGEETEHAMMTLKWLRRADPVFAKHMRTYLFTEGSVLDVEAAEREGGGEGAGGGGPAREPTRPQESPRTLGSLRGDRRGP